MMMNAYLGIMTAVDTVPSTSAKTRWVPLLVNESRKIVLSGCPLLQMENVDPCAQQVSSLIPEGTVLVRI